MVGNPFGVVVEHPVEPVVGCGQRVDVVVGREDGLVVGDTQVGWVGPVQVQGGVVECPL